MILFGMQFYDIVWFFLIYSVLGWVVEVVYCTVTEGRVINRGFLNGPVCPVYGFGMLGLLSCLNLIQTCLGLGSVEEADALVIFAGAMVLASSVELIAGRLLDVLFHARWWDYRSIPFNLNGYICLRFSIVWGLGGVFVIKLVHPTLAEIVMERIPQSYGWPILFVCYALYFADVVVTVLIVQGMNQYLKELDDIQKGMQVFSNAMSRTIGTNALRTQNVIVQGQAQGALVKAEILDRAQETREELSEKAAAAGEMARHAKDLGREGYQKARKALMDKILRPGFFSPRRLLDAFPDLDHRYYNKTIAMLRRVIEAKGEDPEDIFPEDLSDREGEEAQGMEERRSV